ncbi:MAG: hypothetical protein FWB76_00770 [Oscillospiraceae bacterium]|nr:hypothetical protein [Oscillospiraceae bacterium]
MKLLALLLVLLVLAGCGSAAVVDIPLPTVVYGYECRVCRTPWLDVDALYCAYCADEEEVTTSVAETTTRPFPQGRMNGVSWQEINLHTQEFDEFRASIENRQWVARGWPEVAMGNRTLFWRAPGEFQPSSLWVRDNATRTEQILFEGSYSPYEQHLWSQPLVIRVMDERYFLLGWQHHTVTAVTGIFDLDRLEMTAYLPEHVGWRLYWGESDGAHYFISTANEYSGTGPQLHLYRATIAGLGSNNVRVQASDNLLGNIPQAYIQGGWHGETQLSPSAMFFAALSSNHELLIFNVQAQTFVAAVPWPGEPWSWQHQFSFTDDNTIIVYHASWNQDDTRTVQAQGLRITLP